MSNAIISESPKLRAIDLYSGIGGWSLGLRMAGIDVVASYEWWNKAARTNEKNNGHRAEQVNIRELKLEDLPTDIDVVVGSPPCTQFSFANRGGNGDIEDGLRDVEKFLEIVDFLKPKFWAMENVPRTAEIIRDRLSEGKSLAKYSKLLPNIITIDMSEWGLPQARKRCIIGNFDIGLFYQYRNRAIPATLGDVVESLSKAIIFDPIYKIRLSKNQLTDHLVENNLSIEEQRLNREMKTHHPIYNNMSFPDSLHRPGRTVTATCTRVSRESIVIEDLDTPGRYRRLSVRERGCLQGFPITYQFYGDSYAEKLKMIGNAVPPLITFYIAQAMLRKNISEALLPREGISQFSAPSEKPAITVPDKAGNSYSATRRFRLAIPGLRFKSGVRFELINDFVNDEVNWEVRFYFGDSKNIQQSQLNAELLNSILSSPALANARRGILTLIDAVQHKISKTKSSELQDVWTHSSKKGTHPFNVVDDLGMLAGDIAEALEASQVRTGDLISAVLKEHDRGLLKVLRHSQAVLAGMIAGCAANTVFRTDLFLRGAKARTVRAN